MIGFEESDLSDVGDNVVILDDSGLDTHYVDGGRWTVNHIKVERNVVIELGSVVMPGGSVGAGAFIAPLACVMPGETVDTGHWVGNPITPSVNTVAPHVCVEKTVDVGACVDNLVAPVVQ